MCLVKLEKFAYKKPCSTVIDKHWASEDTLSEFPIIFKLEHYFSLKLFLL